MKTVLSVKFEGGSMSDNQEDEITYVAVNVTMGQKKAIEKAAKKSGIFSVQGWCSKTLIDKMIKLGLITIDNNKKKR
jgi:hypothetical protein